MKRSNSRTLVVLILSGVAGLQLAGCGRNARDYEFIHPSHVEHIEGSHLSRVTLTEKAAERIGVQTAQVQEASMSHKRRLNGEIIPAGNEVAVKVSSRGYNLPQVSPGQEATVWWNSSEPRTARAVNNGDDDVHYVLTDGQGMREGDLVSLELSPTATPRKIVPYNAVIYDPHGDAWVYVSPEPLTYVRHPIKIDYIEGDTAVLTDGPPVGTIVATVGVVEIYGTEFQVGH